MRSEKEEKLLSVIIPLYNEEATIVELLNRVWAAELGIRRQIIIVNDGSTDRSCELVEQWISGHKNSDDSIILLQRENGGKGAAVRDGIKRSTGDIVIIQDADLEYDPNEYRRCIEPILDGRAKVVYGSRERFNKNRSHSSWGFYIGGLTLTYWMNFWYGASMTDEPTCYKVFSGDLIRAVKFKNNKFGWEPEVTSKLLRLGYEIHEVPISYSPRKTTEGKKIKFSDGLEGLYLSFIWRFASLNPYRRALLKVPSEREKIAADRKYSYVLWTIVLAALLIRVLFALPGLASAQATFWRPDSGSYITPALSLLSGLGYTDAGGAAMSLRPPGYPLLAMIIFAVSGKSFCVLSLVTCALSALTCIPIFRTARLLLKSPAGVIAAIFWALNITAIAHGPMLLSDTLFTFLVAWQLYFFIRFRKRERLFDFGFGMGLCALSCLVRPISLLWFAVALVLILFSAKTILKKLAGVAIIILSFIIIVAPWMLRNYMVDAGFTVDSNTGNAYYHNGAAIIASVTGEYPSEVRRRLKARTRRHFELNRTDFATVAARDSYKKAKYIELLKEYPLRAVRLHIQPAIMIPDVPTMFENLKLSSSGRGTFDVLRKHGLFAAVDHYLSGRWSLLLPLIPLLALVGILYFSMLAQLFLWLWKRQWYLLLLFAAFVLYFIVLPGPIVMPRYHLPALPMICVMAALFLKNLHNRLGEYRLK